MAQLRAEVAILQEVESQGAVEYFVQEVLRFQSIAGSLIASNLLNNATAPDRQISHILARSLLEGFFWSVYILWDPDCRSDRFEARLNALRYEYDRFWRDEFVVDRECLHPAGEGWSSRTRKDVRNLLVQLRNNNERRLDYLHLVYRIASFDVHGNSMAALLRPVFGDSDAFPVLNLKFGVDLIAAEYVDMIRELKREGLL